MCVESEQEIKSKIKIMHDHFPLVKAVNRVVLLTRIVNKEKQHFRLLI